MAPIVTESSVEESEERSFEDVRRVSQSIREERNNNSEMRLNNQEDIQLEMAIIASQLDAIED